MDRGRLPHALLIKRLPMRAPTELTGACHCLLSRFYKHFRLPEAFFGRRLHYFKQAFKRRARTALYRPEGSVGYKTRSVNPV